jgi:hypothetical protein
VFASRDDGRTWKEIAEALPPVVCVRAAVIGGKAPRAKARRAPARSRSGTARRAA